MSNAGARNVHATAGADALGPVEMRLTFGHRLALRDMIQRWLPCEKTD
jgi:hypothetical protein